MDWYKNKQTEENTNKQSLDYVSVINNCSISLQFRPSSPDSPQVYHETWKEGTSQGQGAFHSPLTTIFFNSRQFYI